MFNIWRTNGAWREHGEGRGFVFDAICLNVVYAGLAVDHVDRRIG
jgi:hypothetical protein